MKSFVRVSKVVALLVLVAVVTTGCRGCKDRMNQWFGRAPGMGDQSGIESSVLPEPIRGQNAQEIPELKRIYFSFDSASLLEPAKEQLRMNAQWLQGNPGMQIQVEGHCDQRGTADYNYALGQRRADATRQYLISQGIEPGRLHTISYGSERPEDSSGGEMSWAKNRRVQFLVYTGQ